MAQEYKPEWAKRVEEWGKEMEKKYGDHHHRHPEPGEGTRTENLDSSCGQNDENKSRPKDNRPRWQRQNNPIGEIVGNIISYFIVTYAPIYFPGFFLDGYPAVRTVIVLSVIVHIATSLVILILPIRPVFYLGRTVLSLAGLVSLAVMATIFPFNIPYGLGHIAQFALWIVFVIVAIVTLFEFLNIFSADR